MEVTTRAQGVVSPFVPRSFGTPAAVVVAPALPEDSVTLSEAPRSLMSRGAALAFLALAVATPLVGCAGPLLSQVPADLPISTTMPLEQRTGYTWNAVRIVAGDQAALDQAVSLIERAGHSVRMEASSFHGAEAERLANALEAKARDHKSVYLLVDPSENSPLLTRLANAGVNVRRYDTSRLPIGPTRSDNANLLVVDDSVAMSGNARWDNENSASFSAVAQGPAVADLRALWNESWGEEQIFNPQALDLQLEPNAAVRVLSNNPNRQETREALLAHIRAAKKEIFIQAFALDDTDIFQALKDARDRSVEVNVLLNRGTRPFARWHGEMNNLGAGINFSEDNNALSFRWFPSNPDRKLRAMVAEFDHETVLISTSYWTGPLASSRQHSIDLLINSKSEVSNMKWDMIDNWQNEGIHAPVEKPTRTFHR